MERRGNIVTQIWKRVGRERPSTRKEERTPFLQGIHHEQIGSMAGVGNYRLVSLDSGQTWYTTQALENGQIQIVGLADPALLKQITAFRALGNLKGSLDLHDPAQVDLLESAGFTVTKKV